MIERNGPKESVTEKYKVLIVDDHPILREGVSQRINREPDLVVCAEAENASQAMKAIRDLKPQIATVDLSLKDCHGLELIKDIQSLFPDLPVLVLSMHDESIYAERALRSGAKGYIMKEEPPSKLIEAIRQVLDGELYVSEKLSAKILRFFSGRETKSGSSPIDQFTDREFEVFQSIGQGLTTQQMAEQLHVSVKTVEVHRINIRKKLHLKTGPELIRYAVRWLDTENLALPKGR